MLVKSIVYMRVVTSRRITQIVVTLNLMWIFDFLFQRERDVAAVYKGARQPYKTSTLIAVSIYAVHLAVLNAVHLAVLNAVHVAVLNAVYFVMYAVDFTLSTDCSNIVVFYTVHWAVSIMYSASWSRYWMQYIFYTR